MPLSQKVKDLFKKHHGDSLSDVGDCLAETGCVLNVSIKHNWSADDQFIGRGSVNLDDTVDADEKDQESIKILQSF